MHVFQSLSVFSCCFIFEIHYISCYFAFKCIIINICMLRTSKTKFFFFFYQLKTTIFGIHTQ